MSLTRSTISRCPLSRCAEDVPRPHPALLVPGGLGLVEVARDVGPGDLQLVALAEADPDAREGEADGAFLVLARRRHRDAARRLGHPEARAELDAVRLEEAEDLGREVAGRREPPAKPSADDRPERGLRGFGRRGLARRRAGAGLQLGPADRDRDQPGRLDLLQSRREAVERRVPGEDVRPAPEEHPEHLEVAPERVVERQEAEEDLLLSDEGECGGPREPLRHQVLHREGDPLLAAGRSRREEDGARLAEAAPRCPRQRDGDGGVGLGGEGLAEDDVALTGQLGRLVEEDDPERTSHVPGRFPQSPEALLRRHDGQVHAERVEGGRQLAGSQVGRDGRDEEAVEEAGEVDAGRVEAVLRDDRHAGLVLEAEERGGDRVGAPRDVGVAPAGRSGAGAGGEERSPGVRQRPAGRASPRGRNGRRRRPRPRRRPTGAAPRGPGGREGGRACGSCRASGARAPARRRPTRGRPPPRRGARRTSPRKGPIPSGRAILRDEACGSWLGCASGERIARPASWTQAAPAPTMRKDEVPTDAAAPSGRVPGVPRSPRERRELHRRPRPRKGSRGPGGSSLRPARRAPSRARLSPRALRAAGRAASVSRAGGRVRRPRAVAEANAPPAPGRAAGRRAERVAGTPSRGRLPVHRVRPRRAGRRPASFRRRTSRKSGSRRYGVAAPPTLLSTRRQRPLPADEAPAAPVPPAAPAAPRASKAPDPARHQPPATAPTSAPGPVSAPASVAGPPPAPAGPGPDLSAYGIRIDEAGERVDAGRRDGLVRLRRRASRRRRGPRRVVRGGLSGRGRLRRGRGGRVLPRGAPGVRGGRPGLLPRRRAESVDA